MNFKSEYQLKKYKASSNSINICSNIKWMVLCQEVNYKNIINEYKKIVNTSLLYNAPNYLLVQCVIQKRYLLFGYFHWRAPKMLQLVTLGIHTTEKWYRILHSWLKSVWLLFWITHPTRSWVHYPKENRCISIT